MNAWVISTPTSRSAIVPPLVTSIRSKAGAVSVMGAAGALLTKVPTNPPYSMLGLGN